MTITKLTIGALACTLLTVFTMSPAAAMPPPGGPRHASAKAPTDS